MYDRCTRCWVGGSQWNHFNRIIIWTGGWPDSRCVNCKQHLGLKKQIVHGLKSTQPKLTKIKSPKILNCTGEEFWKKSFKRSIGEI